MLIQRGYRTKLGDIHTPIKIDFNITGPSEYDISCFAVDKNDQLYDDMYMIFYNQLKSPDDAICMNGTTFNVNLSKLPSKVVKLVFTISIDGDGTMSMIHQANIKLSQLRQEDLELNLTGSNFKDQKAIIAIEIYNKNEWRMNAVANGFNGGLSQLLEEYGGVEEKDDEPTQPIVSQPVPVVQASKISLEKKLEKNAPQLVSLAKPLKLALEKNKVPDIVAKVALILDISGSMSRIYKNRTVQSIVNKILPLAIQFDDNEELDFWYYGTTPKRMDNVTMFNYYNAVPADYRPLMLSLGGGNYEPAVMREIIEEYRNSSIPAYIIFITDGGVGAKREIEHLIVESSRYPIFWQFVGVSGSGYGILKHLDTIKGRVVDNAGFFALDDFNKVKDSELYDRLLKEFPSWLSEAKNKGIIRR
ncbi:VWA domain-containing protein [uncultured Clostridium sp.]|uniref:VWA domain-containing protein n=1 Tax=uncultured Clostridium sp. TaxID=59620 RepID=UPI0028ECA122|nr:VWA domain-containing protein [uncultured Clostridium sp.]